MQNISLIKIITLITLSIGSQTLNAQNQKQYSGINQLTYYEENFNKDFVGNGFLIKHKNTVYAVTVKHTLLEAQTPQMKFVNIEGHIKNWQIHPNQLNQRNIRLGKLINADEGEAIDMKVLTKDWLVFEVESNNSNLIPLEIRSSAVVKGELLTAFGCSYANKTTCKQDEYKGRLISTEENNLRISMPDLDLSKLRGLSGSPVLDENQQLVGIVSNILKAKSGEGFDFAPANLQYLLKILDKIK